MDWKALIYDFFFPITLWDFFSLLGFAFSVWVLVELNIIRKDFLVRARLPELCSKIEKLNSQINTLLNNFTNNQNEILDTLHKLEGDLLNLKEKLQGTQLAQVNMAIQSIEDLRDNELSEDLVRALYGTMLRLIQLLKNSIEDDKWRS